MAQLAQWLTEKGFGAGDLNRADAKGLTPLLRACGDGEAETVKALIAAGADVRALSPDRNNAVWLACASASLDAIRALVAAGVDPNHANGDGATALIYSASAGKRDVVALLLELGADASKQTVDGFTALDLASSEDCFWLLRNEKRKRDARV